MNEQAEKQKNNELLSQVLNQLIDLVYENFYARKNLKRKIFF